MEQKPSLRTFYTLTITQMLSLMGSFMSGFAMALWIYNHTGKVTPLLLTAFFGALPTMIGGGLAGVFADRFERRKLMVFSDAMQTIPTLFYMISFSTGHFALWQLYLGVVFQAIFSMLQAPAVEASITMLVTEDRRDRANAIRQMMSPFCDLCAPILVAFLYSFLRVEGILLIDLITFILAVVVISRMHIPQPAQTTEGKKAQGSVWLEIRGGLRFLLDRRAVLALCVYAMFINFFLVGPLNVTIPYVLTLTDSRHTTGIITGIMNIGPLIGAMVIGVWGGTRPRFYTIAGAMLLAGFSMMVYGVVRTPLLLGVTLFLILLPLPIATTMFTSIIQVKTPPDMQGRIFALLIQGANFLRPLSLLIVGPLVDHVMEPRVSQPSWGFFAPLVGSEAGAGMGLLLVIAGGLLTLLTLIVYAVPQIRRMEFILPDYAPVATVPESQPATVPTLTLALEEA